MRFILILFVALICGNTCLFGQQQAALDSTQSSVLPALSLLSLNTNILKTDRFKKPNLSNLNFNMHYRDIKEGSFVMSKDAFKNFDQFDYEVFKYTPADALSRIMPNYDLNSAPLPPPTYYSND
ncbi:hypothetical protein LB450_08140 [Psychroflexus sp. CAK1W]|uniref:hypothetical protein n=1 Tax=Psychroflexus curvus TaxID=2873595 RepID=UPI001CCB6AF6|nr:hypothetical protein [Psychroflexus curvus]MBZ9628069.1 hypothetical protein [Psychroflexus curvus]